MARVTLKMPEHFPFSTELDVRIEHINRGDHLGNERLIAFLNEARMRYLPAGLTRSAGDNVGLINGDLAAVYRSEAHYGDVLLIRAAASDFHRYGFDLYFDVSALDDGRAIAQAKMGLLLFDFTQRQLLPMSNTIAQAVRGAPDNSESRPLSC